MRIYLPLNEDGISEMENGQEEESINLKIYEFSPDDYYYLESKKYFDFLNVECNALIDIYEDENIPSERLTNAIEITEILMGQFREERFSKLANTLIGIFTLAIKNNTLVNIYCYGDPNIYEK